MNSAVPTDLHERLHAARNVVVLTGAGVSAESGIPTFREAQTGLWAQYSPQDLATPEAFAADPGRVWRWYQWRRQLIHDNGPNDAHRALAELQGQCPHLAVITQNVDGLHQAAGADGVIELHGNLWRLRCSIDCGHTQTLMAPESAERPRPCPNCGAPLRPDVVWFGEVLPRAALQSAADAVANADLLLVAGTSNLVYPAAALPEQALDAGVPVAEINPDRTPLSEQVTWRIAEAASTALTVLRRG